MKRLKILDYFVHQGNQYEFFKTGHKFYLADPSSQRPNWNSMDRPLPSNVKLMIEKEALNKTYDVVIIRSPINPKRYEPFIKRGACPVAVVQTTHPFPLPKDVKHVIWNCREAMKKHAYPGRKNYHIIHGFDPEEFKNLNLEKIDRVLTVANAFRRRREIMGFDLWKDVRKKTKICDLIGHGNEDVDSTIRKAESMDELIKLYNSYKIFFNPTRDSANPRSRGEAAMCGASAIISTPYFDVKDYFQHDKNIIFVKTANETVSEIDRLLKNPDLCEDLGKRAREVAIKHFHINDYVEAWNSIFERL